MSENEISGMTITTLYNVRSVPKVNTVGVILSMVGNISTVGNFIITVGDVQYPHVHLMICVQRMFSTLKFVMISSQVLNIRQGTQDTEHLHGMNTLFKLSQYACGYFLHLISDGPTKKLLFVS